jgi:hypothetical protein
MIYETLIDQAVDNIIQDISNRSGLGNEWEEIDEDIQNEIRNTWITIIKDTLDI